MNHAPSGAAAHLPQASTHLAQTHAIEADPGENEPNDARFFLHNLKACNPAAFIAGDIAISERRPGECADRARASGVPSTASTALQNLGAFIFGDHALNLEQQIILRRIPDRPVQEHDVHASTPKLIYQQRLVGIAPSQAIGGMDIQALDPPAGGSVAKPLESGAHEDGAAVAFVNVTIIRLEQKAIGRDPLAQ